MIPIETILSNAIKQVVGQLGFDLSEEVILEVPRDERHGDLATNVAMRLATQVKQPPFTIAQKLVKELEKSQSGVGCYVSQIEAKAPGFVNFTFSREVLYESIPRILSEREKYGSSFLGKGISVLIEFVSANPTGSLSVAHGRQGAVGDSLANILEFVGYKVSREYYLNDVGNQMDLLAQSIFVRYRQLLGEKLPLPEGGYKGQYVIEISKKLQDARWKVEEWNPEVCQRLRRFGMERILDEIRRDLDFFGVHFNHWFSQEKLENSDKVRQVLEELKRKGFIYEQDRALWFKSSAFGDDKDRVVVKSDRSYTYLTPDIAYHQDKLSRGYQKLINLWGPDHHGYIPRLQAAVLALGYSLQTLVVLIVQLTTLYEGKRLLKMSTREGEFITLREVIESVGRDAARFFFLMRKIDSHLDFDLELAKKQSPENPVYYIQYAHARICSVLEFAKGRFLRRAWESEPLSLLTTPEEIKCLKLLRQFPAAVQLAAQLYEPYYLVPYLQKLAEGFHQFYHQHRVVTDDEELTHVRLALVECVRIVIANGLRLLGVSAPKEM